MNSGTLLCGAGIALMGTLALIPARSLAALDDAGTPTPTGLPTLSPTPVAPLTQGPTETCTETPTGTPTESATATATPTATATQHGTVTETPTGTASETPTATPTETPSPTVTETPTPHLPVTYYVDSAGDDAAAGTELAPWRTVRHAASLVLPGDTVIIRPGIYSESVSLTRSGLEGAPITFQALSGAVLESPDPSASLSAFAMRSTAYLVVTGFEARGGFSETILVGAGSHNIAIRNCDLHNNKLGIWVDSATDVEIDGCRLASNSSRGLQVTGSSRRVTVRNTVSRDHDDGLGCSGEADGFQVQETAADIRFFDCVALGNGEDGFDLQGDRILVARSQSRGNACSGIKLWQNARVENTLVTGNRTGISTTALAPATPAIEIINSTIADNGGTQLRFTEPLGSNAVASAYSVSVRNVIAAGPGKAIDASTTVLLTEEHNIFFREDTTSPLVVLRFPSDLDALHFSGQQINAGEMTAATGHGNGTWAIDPDFIDRLEYRVAVTSVAIDSGDPTDAPIDDLDRAPRPQGSRTDIGAYESVITALNHRPWADPGAHRSTTADTALQAIAFGSVDPDGDALTYQWDFGDGSAPAIGFAVPHRWTTEGNYTVTLTASDGALTQSRTTDVSVSPRPTHTATATASDTPTETPSPTSSSTATATLSPTASVTATAVETPTPSATQTPAETETPSPSATPTASLTPTASMEPATPTATELPTASPTAPVLGDANCDGQVTVADVTKLVVPSQAPVSPDCGVALLGEFATTVAAIFGD